MLHSLKALIQLEPMLLECHKRRLHDRNGSITVFYKIFECHQMVINWIGKASKPEQRVKRSLADTTSFINLFLANYCFCCRILIIKVSGNPHAKRAWLATGTSMT